MDGDCDYALRISADANRDLVDRFYREVITKRRLDAIDELISEDFVDNGERRGREGQRRVYEEFLGAFPDLQTEIVEILAADDLVAVHRRWTGTHSVRFQGVDPTGRSIDFQSTAILKVRAGRIAEYHGVLDMLTLMEHLGAAREASF